MSLVRFFYEEYYKDNIVNVGGFEPGLEYHPGTLQLNGLCIFSENLQKATDDWEIFKKQIKTANLNNKINKIRGIDPLRYLTWSLFHTNFRFVIEL